MLVQSTITDLHNLPAIKGARVSIKPIVVGSINLFARGRVHEAMGPSCVSLALCLGAACASTIFWTGQPRTSCALRAFGISRFFDPKRLIRLETASRRETLWAGEEALRCKGAGLVVLQMETGPDLFESHRLQIAAQAGGGIGLVLIGRRAQSSATQTRWHCTPHISHDDHSSGWLWDLTKNKSGHHELWSVRWINKETGRPAVNTPHDLIERARAVLHKTSPIALSSRGLAETTHVRAHATATARPLGSPG